MTVGIYGIFDSKTDECLYIGMSKNIEQRWKSHLKNLRNKRHPRKDFTKWYHSNGAVKELLLFRILEECEYDVKILNSCEIKWFNKMRPKYYGKKPSLNEKWEHSEETRRKISDAGMGKEPWNKKSPGAKSLYIFVCLHCEENFESIKTTQKFCSRKCQAEFAKQKSANEYDYDYIYDLYWNQGLSRPQIAEKLGVGRTTALKIMNRLGIPRRSADEGLKTSIKQNKKYSEGMSERLKSLPKKICQYCDKEFSAMNIKRHETSCQTYPCCGIKLKKKTSKTCQKHRSIRSS